MAQNKVLKNYSISWWGIRMTLWYKMIILSNKPVAKLKKKKKNKHWGNQTNDKILCGNFVLKLGFTGYSSKKKKL